MSWLIGITGETISQETVQRIKKFLPLPAATIHIPSKFFAAAGGNPDTIHCFQQRNSAHTLITGIGISADNSSSRILTSQEWEEILSSDPSTIEQLNGHFTIVQYHANDVRFFSDRVGLRTLYFAQSDDGWIFSSRLSWIKNCIDHSSIKWEHAGSRWFCGQSFSYDVPIAHTHKLPPNGRGTIHSSRLSIHSAPWTDRSSAQTAPWEVIKILRRFISFPGKKIKLGLSGGLDSRLLLSLLRSQNINFSAYAFGLPHEPDIRTAQKICEDQNIPFQFYHDEFPSSDQSLSLLTQYMEQSNLLGPGSMSVRQRWYPFLRENDSIVIDGGNGEIARRQFFTLLKLKAKNDLVKHNARNLFSHLQSAVPGIFNKETVDLMKEGAVAEIASLFQTLPDPDQIGLDAFLDGAAVATRIPNIACDEQARLDEHIIGFMPFSQPDFIASVLRLPLEEKHNSRLFKTALQQNDPILTRYPLIKNNISYPYALTTLQARVWSKAQYFLRPKKNDPTVEDFLDAVKEFVLDTLSSQSVKTYPNYNYPAILNIVTRYYNGEKRCAAAADRWIGFDIWRTLVEK